jgi:hypothetical protein
MNNLNKTTMVGLLVFTLLLGIGITKWLTSGGDESSSTQTTAGSQPTEDASPTDPTTSVAPTYGDEDADPIIQISEETLKKSRIQEIDTLEGQDQVAAPSNSNDTEEALEIPSGFGLAKDNNSQAEKNNLEEMAVNLETPTESIPSENLDVSVDPNSKEIQPLDPRDVGITANDGPEQNYEETALTVQRTLTAVNTEGEKQLIRMKIPVMYKSRTLRLEGETKTKALSILSRLKEKSQQLENLKKELDQDLIDWNNLVKAATPYDSLLPESPTLPQNQSAGGLNRDNNPEMSAGKSISYEIVPTEEPKNQ